MNIQNAIQLPSGKILMSKHRHDYQSEEGYMVDGGLEYFRRGFPEIDLSTHLYLDENSTILEICNTLICEAKMDLWKNIPTRDKIQTERLKILEDWQRKADHKFSPFTRNHAFLHLYVSGYWIVQKARL